VPYLRGYGPTRFLAAETPRSGQQAALGNDLKELIDALGGPRVVLAGYDWGGRAACVVAALWPDKVRGLVSANGYNIQDIAGSTKPVPPEQSTAFGISITSTPSAGAPDCKRIDANSASCCGDCGHRTGGSMTRPMTAPQPLSTIPTLSTS
jgi:pimeloyl-ACP methyl ester carboxylesterase